MTRLLRSSKFWLLERALLVVITLTIAGVCSRSNQLESLPLAKGDEPVFLDYRGVKIGWLADEVRKKLGSPANKGDEQDFYIFSEKETCQILYDKATNKVTAISVDFMSGAREVITPQQVFGEDIRGKARWLEVQTGALSESRLLGFIQPDGGRHSNDYSDDPEDARSEPGTQNQGTGSLRRIQ